MSRRRFLKVFAGSALATMFSPLKSIAQSQTDPEKANLNSIDPYFLQSGDVSDQERVEIEQYIDYVERSSDGRPAVIPRGGRPKRAPTYRFLRWQGELGDSEGAFVGPLSVEPETPPATSYAMNAQILNLHTSSADWPDEYTTGTLSVEIRSRIRGESLTWLYAEQFELFQGGQTSIGLEYVGQRDSKPEPVSSDESNIDFRIQLMRHKKKDAGGFLTKIFKVASAITGLGSGGDSGLGQLTNVAPPLRVPQMVLEGVGVTQAILGTAVEETPLWRSGFTSYSIAPGGSRLGLKPGLWVAVDGSRQVDLRNARLEDVGGRVTLTQDGKEVDVNYLVLGLDITVKRLPDKYYEKPPESEESDSGEF